MAVFYRVVSVAEYEDILLTKRFRAVPHSMQFGKHFWGSVESALKFASRYYLEGEYIIIRVEVSDAAAARFHRFDHLDRIGAAWFAGFDDLVGATMEKVIE